ncbi:MAG TPA: ASPIC/UnbV domain-containing protein [Verrucomicrobiales bacterium]|nr:ASPIC/UnbV domain-containing protein [Verrucomicrobiales bacterium]
MDQLIDSGHTFSGGEAKCAFLNLGDGTFATVSALSGVDFPDDGRSLALTDWDGDGDLDAWMTCRTAPMLRYLRNDSPHANRSLLLKLEGTTGSRDAAGARAEVRLKGQPDKPLLRTVKCGEGYLGQSSRWLHFGLGSGAEIESVRITWPGGKKEEIKECRPNTAVTFTEGDLFPQSRPFKSLDPALSPAPLTPRRAELAGAVTLFQPALFPPLPSIGFDGKPWAVTDTGGPVLVNLFASWCPDCEKELTAWRDAAPQFKAAGLSLALLSADGRDTAHATGPADARAWLGKHGISFPAGVLSEEAFRRLTVAHRTLFGAIVDLPVPSSFLLDGKGRLAAVYRGPVSVERILADTALAVKNDEASRGAAALPWAGRWLQVPDPPDPSLWLTDFVSQRSWDEAAAFFQRHAEILRKHKDFTLMAASLGDKLAAAGKGAAAIAACEAGLTKSPDSPELLNNLAGLLATGPDKSLHNPARALALAGRAVALTSGKNPALLDTLASAQAAGGDFTGAADTAAKALTLAQTTGETALIPLLEKALSAYRAGHRPQ